MPGARHIGKLAASILVALALFGAASPSVAEQHSADPEVVEVTVGTHRYAIPKSYILAVRRDPKDDSVRRVMMQALWPGLEPFGLEIVNLRAHTNKNKGYPKEFHSLPLLASVNSTTFLCINHPTLGAIPPHPASAAASPFTARHRGGRR